MKRFKLTFILLVIISTSSLFATSESFRLIGFSPAKIVFESNEKGFMIKTNLDNISFFFYDSDGNITDAYSAKTFKVTTG